MPLDPNGFCVTKSNAVKWDAKKVSLPRSDNLEHRTNHQQGVFLKGTYNNIKHTVSKKPHKQQLNEKKSNVDVN